MDFFEHQDRARTNTFYLLVLFCTAIVLMTLTIYSLLSVVMEHHQNQDYRSLAWSKKLSTYVATGVFSVVGLGAVFKINSLSGGGKVIAESLGGRKINHQTQNPNEKRILNIVSEMAIASGLPVPPVYLINEVGINAFAAGYSPNDAVIGITEGCSKRLNRDQLQGVVAHEFSHILNGDMRLNIRLCGFIHGIICLSDIGKSMLRVGLGSNRGRRKDSDKGGGFIILLGFILTLVGMIGAFFGSMIRAAVSRQREFLADAAAVQFTRNPGGIAGALKRIGGFTKGSKFANTSVEEFSHMFFGSTLIHFFSTHPPLIKRIARIEPGWKKDFPNTNIITERADAKAEGIDLQESAQMGFAREPTQENCTTQSEEEKTPKPMNLEKTLEVPSEKEVKRARELISSLPQSLIEQAREPHGACSLVFSLLLDPRESVHQIQVCILKEQAESGTHELSVGMKLEVQKLKCIQKLALFEESTASLSQLSESQIRDFQNLTDQLINADKQIDFFEWTISKIIQDFINRTLSPNSSLHGRSSIREKLPACSIFLGALAHFGQENKDPLPSYTKGFRALDAKAPVDLPPLEKCEMDQLDDALTQLVRLTPLAKRSLLNACRQTIEHDGKSTDIELQILRGLAAAISCPLRLA